MKSKYTRFSAYILPSQKEKIRKEARKRKPEVSEAEIIRELIEKI